jgi:hypothetical protein
MDDQQRILIQNVTMMAAHWLARGNELFEAGHIELAEKAYEKSQIFHDRMNKLMGNG